MDLTRAPGRKPKEPKTKRIQRRKIKNQKSKI
jgi:hypothetical protein